MKSEECSVRVVSVTFDGAGSNILMAKELGCTLDMFNLKPWFMFNNKKIYVVYDACHMLKLVRNAFGELKTLVCANGNVIKWEYITLLNDLQKNEGLHQANTHSVFQTENESKTSD